MSVPHESRQPQYPGAPRAASGPVNERYQWLGSVPGFLALWRVGEARGVDVQQIEAERFLLVAEDPIRGEERRKIEARLAATQRSRLLRLRTTTPARLCHAPRLCCREAWDLALEADLLAGEDTLRKETSKRGLGSPQPKAALELFRSFVELLLRAYPSPYMLRSAVLRGLPVGFPEFADPTLEERRVHAELIRGIGDAWLLLLGRYTTEREERGRRLAEHFASRPLFRHLLHYAFAARPLEQALPEDTLVIWSELRGLLLDGYAGALQQMTGGICPRIALPDFIEASPKGFFGRLTSILFHGPSPRADRIDALMLQLVIAKQDDGSEDFGLLGSAIRRMRDAEGPTLANPSWDKLRREALCLRGYLPDQEPQDLPRPLS